MGLLLSGAGGEQKSTDVTGYIPILSDDAHPLHLILSLSASMPTVLNANPHDLTAMLATFDHALDLALQDQNLWSLINLILQILFVALGIASTLFMALQNANNQSWMKPLGIVATTLTAGIGTVYGTFHIRENITTVFNIERTLLTNRNELEGYIRKHPDEHDNPEVEQKYADIINEAGIQRRSTWGLIGKIEPITK